ELVGVLEEHPEQRLLTFEFHGPPAVSRTWWAGCPFTSGGGTATGVLSCPGVPSSSGLPSRWTGRTAKPPWAGVTRGSKNAWARTVGTIALAMTTATRIEYCRWSIFPLLSPNSAEIVPNVSPVDIRSVVYFPSRRPIS